MVNDRCKGRGYVKVKGRVGSDKGVKVARELLQKICVPNNRVETFSIHWVDRVRERVQRWD